MFPENFVSIRVPTLTERDLWIRVINHSIASQLSKTDRGSTSIVSSPSGASKQTKRRGVSVKSRKNRFHYLKILRERSAANGACADCTAKNPDWGLTNWGVLVCKECSGVHRGLGVHISRVQSLTLDRWPFEVFQLIKSLGNEKTNKVLESRLPRSEKIGPDCSRADREAFIMKKYRERAYCARTKSDPTADLLPSCSRNAIVNTLSLIAQGANIDCQPIGFYSDPLFRQVIGRGRSLLHCLVLLQHTSVPILELLAQHGAQIDIQDEDGWTPLHCAAAVDSLHATRLLLRNLANPTIANYAGQTPLDLAKASGSTQVGRLLLGNLPLQTDEYHSDDEAYIPAHMRLNSLRTNAFEQIQLIRAKLTLLRHDVKSKESLDDLMRCAHLLRLLKFSLLSDG